MRRRTRIRLIPGFAFLLAVGGFGAARAQEQRAGEGAASEPSAEPAAVVPPVAWPRLPQATRADGLPYRIDAFELSYAQDHPEHPPIAEVMDLEILLGEVADGYVAPREDLPLLRIRLADVPLAGPEVYYGSAIRTIEQRIVEEFVRRGLAGLLVLPDEDDIDPDSNRDLRPPGRTALGIVIWEEALVDRPTFRRPGEGGEAEAGPDRRRRPLPPPLAEMVYDLVPIPDRWRLLEALGVNERFWDPYHQSTLKADRPIFGTQDWFFNLALVSDTVVEPRRLPTPVGQQANRRSGTLDIFGDDEQLAVVQNFIVSTAFIKGDTVFRPLDWEFRFTGVGNINYTEVETLGLVRIDPTRGRKRTDGWFGPQDLFVDKHLWNKSDRYDFDSLRLGVQPFISDFRGFVFRDNQLGARLFGTFRNNRLQYNLAYFRRIEKDTNSGLNKWFDMRDDDIFAVNAYYQDFPVLGFTLQGTVLYNRNREDGDRHFNQNGFLERPAPVGDARGHDYDVVYLGLSGDGHIDRLNLTFSAYYATGIDDRNSIAQRRQTINAWLAAAEASLDFDWMRFKAFAFFTTGDDDPFDGYAEGFDAIFENPNFAGASTSFWQRQAIPLINGGGVILSGRNALIPSLRTSKEEGQSNFVNPGLLLAGVGADFDILPELRFVANASWLRFDNTSSLETLRVQGDISKEIGWDLSGAIIYRPLFIQNVVLQASGAVLLPGKGIEELFEVEGSSDPYYSVLLNLVLTY